jgi:hypothetical protein
MRYSLRTLVILATLGPPLLAIAWMYREWPQHQKWTFHFTAGACFVLLYPAAVLQMSRTMNRLTWPPAPRRLSRLEVAAIVLAILVTCNAAAFVFSVHDPWRPTRSYTPWESARQRQLDLQQGPVRSQQNRRKPNVRSAAPTGPNGKSTVLAESP